MVVAEGVECHKLALTLLEDTPFFAAWILFDTPYLMVKVTFTICWFHKYIFIHTLSYCLYLCFCNRTIINVK